MDSSLYSKDCFCIYISQALEEMHKQSLELEVASFGLALEYSDLPCCFIKLGTTACFRQSLKEESDYVQIFER